MPTLILEAIAAGDPGLPGWGGNVARAMNDVSRRLTLKDAWNIARAAFAAQDVTAHKQLFLGSSTFAGVGASDPTTTSIVARFAALEKIGYPLDSGSHPAPFLQTLAQAASSPPTAPGLSVVGGAVSGAESSTVLTTTTKNQVIAYGPQSIVWQVGSNDWSRAVPSATYKANMAGWISAIDAGYSADAKPVHLLCHAHSRGDSTGNATAIEPWSNYRDRLVELVLESTTGNVAFVDQQRPYAAAGLVGTVGANPRQMFRTSNVDYIHLSDKGHRFGADALANELGIR